MGLVTMGLSHKTAPVELREHLAIPAHELAPALERLQNLKELKEIVILSTCNRLEIYARPETTREKSLKSMAHFFSEFYKHLKIGPALYKYEAFDAVRHLFRVASGLDSMVVGESEVLGQVKSAYQWAHEHGTTGKITNVLFQRALYVGKHVRTKTNISKGSSSVGSIAVHLAERIFGSLSHHRVLLLGAGKMAEVTAHHLLSQKAGDIVVLNRTASKADALAKLLNGVSGSIDDLENELIRADIVICSVTTDKPLVTKKMMDHIMKARRGRSIYFIDIAVPRNVEDRINNLDNAYVYNIDDLQSIVQESLSRRKKEVDDAEKMVSELSHEFYGWITAALEGKASPLKHGAVHHPRTSA